MTHMNTTNSNNCHGDQCDLNDSKLSQPKVSIVLPTFERSHKIRNTIDSILSQTYDNYEIIIVDDNHASSPHKSKTRDVVSDYLHLGNILYLSNIKNLGACATRNIGINASTGKYIAFIDDDDQWLSFKLEVQIGLLTSNPHTDFATPIYSSLVLTLIMPKLLPGLSISMTCSVNY